MAVSPLPVLVAVSGIVCLVAGDLVRRRWTKPGATWFTVAAVACALWALAYAAGMLVSLRGVHELLELPIWIGHGVAPVAFLLFVAAYTGQLESISTTTRLLLWIVPLVTVGMVLTNAAHGGMWTDYEVVTVADAATARYRKGPWLYVHKLYSYAILAAAAAMIVELFVDRDALYTAQAAALTVVVVPLGLASVTWLFGRGPYPLSLTPFLFGPVFGVGSVVLFRSDLFDSPPAARRIGRRRLLDDFGGSVLVVDGDGRIVEANDAASDLFDRADLLDRTVEDVLGDAVSLDSGRHEVRLDTPDGRQPYEVTVSPVTDEQGTQLGHSLVLQDVSEQTRRRQQLAVLNRVLRHNLRNDMTVVRGYTEQLAEDLDGHQAEMASIAADQAADLIALGETARDIERVLGDGTVEEFTVHEAVSTVCENYPDLTSDVDVPTAVTIEARPDAFRTVLDAVVENAVEHGGEHVTVTADRGEEWTTVRIADDGPGIPDHELAPIRTGTETDLEHGSGLGLWLIAWGVDSFGGEVRFETPETGGTVVELRIPVRADGD